MSAERLIFGGLLLLLFWAPLPLASESVVAGGLLAFGLTGLLALLLMLKTRESFELQSHRWDQLVRAWPALLALVGFLMLLILQTLPFTNGPVSVDPHRTLFQIMLTLGYISGFVLVLLLVNSANRMRQLGMVLVISGLFQAILAIVLTSTKARYSVAFFPLDHASHALGSFGYRNSLANYLLISISVGIGLVLANLGFSQAKAQSAKEVAARMLHFLLSPAMLLRIMLVVMVVALVMTRSRMGNAGLLITLLLVGLPILFFTGRIRRRGLVLIASILVIDVVIVGSMIGLDRVVERLNETPIQVQGPDHQAQGFSQESLETRSGPAALVLGMVAERPLLGFGAGSFYTAFPRFSASEFTGFYDHAHNDYAQFAAETGLVGLGLLAIFLLASIARALRVVARPHSATDFGVALGALLALGAVLAHATVDFHFQMPAIALTVVAVIAMVWAARIQGQTNDLSL